MPTIVHEFAWPDRLVVGTVGRPGSREFYLQARTKARIVTVALEKEQSARLAAKIDEVLEQPLDTQFRTGAMRLGWDPTTSLIVIEAYALADVEDADSDEFGSEPTEVDPPESLLVHIPVGMARAFTKRTLEVVGAGRPSCPLCGYPMNPEGHVCPQPGAP